MQAKVTIGMLVQSPVIRQWQYNIIAAVKQLDEAEIKLILLKGYHPEGVKTKRQAFLFHEWVDNLIFKKKSTCDAMIDSSLLFHPENLLEVVYVNGLPAEESLRRLANQHLDVIINFASHHTFSDLTGCSRLGMWQYRIGENPPSFEYADGYLEVVHAKPQLGLAIVATPSTGTPLILLQTYIKMYEHSMVVNRNNAWLLAETYFTRVIKNAIREGDAFFTDRNTAVPAAETVNTPVHAPGLFSVVRNMFRITSRYIIAKLRYTKKNDWVLLCKFNDGALHFPPSIDYTYEIASPADRFWADPFPIIKNGKHYIFFEELLRKTNKGHISVMEVDPSGVMLQKKDIIQKTYHMSYPQLVEQGSDLYMIPETSANKTIEVYKCVTFPDQWEFVRNLMEAVSATDTTLFFHNNRWWLFTSLKVSKHTDVSELHVFYADDLLSSSWVSHPRNPVNTDIRYERGAGNIFTADDHLYRPSQDCSGVYGKAINFNEIISLDPANYEEKLQARIEINDYSIPTGTHTFNYYKGFRVIDMYQRRNKLFKNKKKGHLILNRLF
jgi:hypothetical protein